MAFGHFLSSFSQAYHSPPKRANSNGDDSNPIRFDFTNGELNLLSLFDTIDDNTWYLMANLNLEGPLGQLYPVVISSGDVRGEPGRNVGDVYLNQLTPYGQLHPLQTNKRYWYQVMVTADKQIIVSFRDATDDDYHVYLQGYLSEAVNPQVASFHGPLSLNWIESGSDYRVISGTFIRGAERFITWASSETASQQQLTHESPSEQTQTLQVLTQAGEFLDGIQMEKLDGFDTSSKANWDLGKIGAISNGMLEMMGDEIDWNQIGLNRSLLEGQGLLFFARYTHGAQFDMFLQSGAWEMDSYRRFGINGGGKPSEHIWFGTQYTGDFLSGDFSPEPDLWYCVLMAIDNQANVLVAIWNPEHSEEKNFYTKELDEESQGQYWGLVFEVFSGTLQIDDFFIISFDSIK